MKAPYQPMFWGDFYAETRGLTFLQSSIYLHLQAAYWSNGGPLPEDDAEDTARLIGCTKNEWLENSSAVLKFFKRRGGKFVHEGLDARIASATRLHQGLKERGAKGGKASVIKRISRTGQAHTAHNGSSILSQAKPSQEEKKETPQPPKGGLDGFEDFWSAYFRRDSRRSAEKAWPSALQKVGGDPSILVQAAKAYSRPFRAGAKERQYQKLAATWLNGENWNDQVSAPAPAPRGPTHEEYMRMEHERVKSNVPMEMPDWMKGD